MQEIILLKGLPASGKSTWAKDFVEHHVEYVRVNKDDLREMLNIRKFSRRGEKVVLKLEREIGMAALSLGKSLIVDDTNFNPIHAEFWSGIASTNDLEYSEITFDTPLEECIERDSKRVKSVGNDAIIGMYKKYIKNQKNQKIK